MNLLQVTWHIMFFAPEQLALSTKCDIGFFLNLCFLQILFIHKNRILGSLEKQKQKINRKCSPNHTSK